MKNNRFLNIAYAIEVLNGRLNGSASQVENNKSGFDNITFTKKINGKGYVSAPCIKKGIQKYQEEQGYELSTYKKDGKKIKVSAHPHKFINEEIGGFMIADKDEITKEEYEQLSDDIKKLYKSSKKVYTRDVTKKRSASLQMNGLIGVGNSKINKEWGVCNCNDGDNMPYVLETYSDIMSGIANFDINKVGVYNVSDKTTEFRDYSTEEAETLKIENLSKEEKIKRIETTLKGIQYLSLKSNQSNHLVDTMPKIVVLSEYNYGNNVFQGIINKSGINIEGIEETVEDCDCHRNSPIWIGVSSKIMNEKFQGLKEKLQEELKGYDFIRITSVGKAFDGYLNYLKETL